MLNTSLHFPLAPPETKATDQVSPTVSVLSESHQPCPSAAHLLGIGIKVAMPGFSWPAPLSLSLGVPSEGLPCGVGGCFA